MHGNTTIVKMKNNLVMNKVHKKKEQGLAKKQDITTAAEEVLFEKGAAATTIEQIAERANVTRGAIYWHFKNKNEILEQIIDKAAMPLLESLRAMLDKTQEVSLAHLRASNVQSILKIVRSREDARRLTIFLLKCEHTAEFQYLIDKQTQYHNEIREIYIAYLKKVEEQEGSLIKSPELIADALIFYSAGMLTQFFKEPQRIDIDRHITDYLDIFFLSLTNRPFEAQGKTSP